MLRIQRRNTQFRVTEDHPQHIIEIMSNAAGEATDRFHLLDLPHLCFQPDHLRNIPLDADKINDISV